MQEENELNLNNTAPIVQQPQSVVTEQFGGGQVPAPQNPNSPKKSKKMMIIIAAVVALAIAGALTYYFVSAKNSSSDSNATSQPTATPTPSYDTTDWDEYLDGSTGVTYFTPAWNGATVVLKYKVDEDISVGTGSTTSVRYLSASNEWKTMEAGTDGVSVAKSDNIVSSSTVKVQDKYAASYFSTGDTQNGQTSILVVKDGDVYAFTLPATCDGIMCSGDKAWTTEKINEIVPAFISKIQLP